MLKALLLAERATAAKLAGHNEHLWAVIKELQRALFGSRCEKTAHPDQLQLALEEHRADAGPDPPAVVYLYAPGHGAEHAIRPLAGFNGVLQVDAYAA